MIEPVPPHIPPPLKPSGGSAQRQDSIPDMGTAPAARVSVGDTPADHHVSLSLVSHTNVGKTTLARTMLGREIGEVRDEAHVTDTTDRFVLIETPEGDVLSLWDTPGFGDSARLARRLSKAEKPVGWVVSQVWDRMADRALYSSQQAVRNVRDDADVVLYLVNAAEDPTEAGYVDPEMSILEWIGKPIIVLVNQIGPPAGPAAEAAEIDVWARHLQDTPAVRRVLALDAFARCWVQEGVLLAEVARWLPEAKQPSFERLRRAWMAQRRAVFDRSMDVLAARVANAALDREEIEHGGLRERLMEVGSLLRVVKRDDDGLRKEAMARMAARLSASVRETTDQVIALHGLTGHAGDQVLERLTDHFAVTDKVSESRAAVYGGLVTGALAGLKADILSGGLTLGGGLILGGILGAAGGAGLARGYNMVRGADSVTVSWTSTVLDRAVSGALMTYLAVAHYGRGRGEWSESEHPKHWESTVADVLREQKDAFDALWKHREAMSRESMQRDVRHQMTVAAERILARLYPDAASASGIGAR